MLGQGQAWASNWKKVGSPVPGATTKLRLKNSKPGDVVVISSDTSESGSHVAFYAGHDPKTGKVYLLGGNQADEVNITNYDISRIQAVRRVRVDRITDTEQERLSQVMIQDAGST